jgi:hypothetical protein
MTANREPSNQSFETDREATVCTANRRFLLFCGVSLYRKAKLSSRPNYRVEYLSGSIHGIQKRLHDIKIPRGRFKARHIAKLFYFLACSKTLPVLGFTR